MLLVITLGFLVLVRLRPGLSAETLAGIAFFAAMAFIAEAIPVHLPTGDATISVSFVVIYASILLFGPGEASWIAAFGTLRLKDITGKVPLHVVMFNRAQLAISVAVAGFVYSALGGIPLTSAAPFSLVPSVLCGITYLMVNTALLVGVLSLSQSVPPWRMFISNFRWTMPNLLVFQPLGIMVARVYMTHGPQTVTLFIIPLFIARYSFQLYIKMRRAYLDTILTLTASLDAKDPYTFGHSERVANYSVEIARAMGLGYEQVELLRYVGVLHDIGKIGIRDSILKKPGVFTHEEYEEMKRHPRIGADIISSIRLSGGAATWVKHHHERYDGTGFPDGLKAEQIPLGARIIAVADALDAITTVRPYKPALDWDRALDEMKQNSGTQFDPEVVDALIKVYPNIRPTTKEVAAR